MKKLILLVIIALSAYSSDFKIEDIEFTLIAQNQSKYKCDGRQYCSQMTSCEEAKFFLKNCLDTKMDGDKDGIPCERQWCGRR